MDPRRLGLVSAPQRRWLVSLSSFFVIHSSFIPENVQSVSLDVVLTFHLVSEE